MNTLIFLTALVSLGCTLVALYHITMDGRRPTVSRWLFGSTHIFYDCKSCGSPVEAKFENRTDRMLEHTYCPCCGEPKEL